MTTVVVARAADTLTLARVPLAVMMALVIAADRLRLAAVVLVCGWITDTLDGILARRARGMTRFGLWDVLVDGVMAMGLMVGLALGGYVTPAWLIPTLVLGGLLLSVRSLASGMLLQGMAYVWFLRTLAAQDREALVLLLWAIGVAAITHGYRVPRVLIPRFFADVARLNRKQQRNRLGDFGC